MTPEMKQQLVATFNPVTGYIENDGPISPEFLAVNHIESMNPPLNPRTPPLFRLPSQNHTTIGDLLSNAGVSWRYAFVFFGRKSACSNASTLTGNAQMVCWWLLQRNVQW
jgi:hypothetical protein